MKKLVRTFLGILAVLLLPRLSSALESKEEYTKELTSLTFVIKHYNTENFYSKLEFKDKKTGKARKLADFEEMDRFIFIMMQMNAINHALTELQNNWVEELKTAEDGPDDEKIPNKKDMQEYLDKLYALRKDGAKKLEAMIDSFFKKWPDKFTDEEKAQWRKTVQEYHDKNKLIERGEK